MIDVRPHLRRLVAATAILVTAWAAPARGDTCSDCGPPADAVFREAMGGSLHDSGEFPDYYAYEGGPCEVAIGPITAKCVGQEAISAGSGEVQTCPSGTGVAYLKAQLTIGPEHSWSLTSDAGGDLGPTLVEKMAAAAEAAGCPASGTPKALAFDQTIRANWCRVLPWRAWFLLSDYEATADYTISRQFRWWVKNDATGDLVFASGTLIHPCESGTATMKRRWPVEARLDTVSKPCPEPCTMPTADPVKTEPEPPKPEEPAPAPTPSTDGGGSIGGKVTGGGATL